MAGRSQRKNPKRSHPSSLSLSSSSTPSSSSLSLPSNLLSPLMALALLLSLAALFVISSNTWFRLTSSGQFHQIHTVDVVNELAHDRNAFTQGLVYGGNDTLFESTGLYGRSSVRKVSLETGKVEALTKMDSIYFGEGLTLLGERLYQVTWLRKTGFIYDRNDLSQMKEFNHEMTDGWGLATDGKVLFGSDGTSSLYQIDPRTFKVLEKHTVKYNGREVPNLNELEFINNEVWANVYQTDCIARISPKDGSLIGWILLPQLREELWKSGERDIDVLNGIALDSDKHRVFVTGKLWPKLFEVKLRPIKKPLSNDHIEHLCIPSPFQF